jgi:hypothetical protein
MGYACSGVTRKPLPKNSLPEINFRKDLCGRPPVEKIAISLTKDRDVGFGKPNATGAVSL